MISFTARSTEGLIASRETCADLVRLMGVSVADAQAVASRIPVMVRRVAEQTPLFVQGSPADALYVARHGHFKLVHTDREGYEQVLDFASRLDLLGGDVLAGAPHAWSAMALEDSSAWVLPLRELRMLRRDTPGFEDAFERALAVQLLHAGELAELMNAVASEVRLARFVLHQAARAASKGLSPRRLVLPMTRKDIGSYLGLAHETVSRGFGQLCRIGCIRVRQKEIEITDLDGLAACARNTRGRWVPPAAATHEAAFALGGGA
jgi:CRP/FNR family transcriptional regulator